MQLLTNLKDFTRKPLLVQVAIGIFGAFCAMVIYFYFHDTQFLIISLGGGIIFASGLIEDFRGNLTPKMRLLLNH